MKSSKFDCFFEDESQKIKTENFILILVISKRSLPLSPRKMGNEFWSSGEKTEEMITGGQ